MSNLYNSSQLATTNQLVDIFITESENLAILLEKEAQYFGKLKVEETEKHAERKNMLVSELEKLKEKILADKAALKNLPADVKAKIINCDDKLKKASEENFKQATIAKEVNRILMEAVYDAVAKHKTESKGYGKSGVYGNDFESGTAIAINQSV